MRFIGGEDSGTACAYVLFYRTVDEEENLLERASLVLPPTSKHAAPSPPDGPAEIEQQAVAVMPPVDIPSPPSAAKKTLARAPSMPLASTPSPVAMRRSATAILVPDSKAPTTPQQVLVSPSNTRDGKANGFSRVIPAVHEDHHHGPYTRTQITSTPLEELDEPDWQGTNGSGGKMDGSPEDAKPVRPRLAEKKSGMGLGRFSSFRGKKSFSFSLNKKDVPNGIVTEQSQQANGGEETSKTMKRRSSVFGMGK
jgi:hypothetical protein